MLRVTASTIAMLLVTTVTACGEDPATPSTANIEAVFKAEVESRSYCPKHFTENYYPALAKAFLADGLVEPMTYSGLRLTPTGQTLFGKNICFGRYGLVSIDEISPVYNTAGMSPDRYLDHVDVKATYTLRDRPEWAKTPRYLSTEEALQDSFQEQRPFRFFLRNGKWVCESQDGHGDCIL